MASKLKLINANGNTLTIENGDTSNSDMNIKVGIEPITAGTHLLGGKHLELLQHDERLLHLVP